MILQKEFDFTNNYKTNKTNKFFNFPSLLIPLTIGAIFLIGYSIKPLEKSNKTFITNKEDINSFSLNVIQDILGEKHLNNLKQNDMIDDKALKKLNNLKENFNINGYKSSIEILNSPLIYREQGFFSSSKPPLVVHKLFLPIKYNNIKIDSKNNETKSTQLMSYMEITEYKNKFYLNDISFVQK
jgi:hypothetical protein